MLCSRAGHAGNSCSDQRCTVARRARRARRPRNPFDPCRCGSRIRSRRHDARPRSHVLDRRPARSGSVRVLVTVLHGLGPARRLAHQHDRSPRRNTVPEKARARHRRAATAARQAHLHAVRVHGIPIDIVEIHPQWIQDAQWEGLRSQGVQIVFCTFSATVETFPAIEQYEPDIVGTSEARLMVRWLER